MRRNRPSFRTAAKLSSCRGNGAGIDRIAPRLIEAFREELICYGELLCLLESQQKLILAKAAEPLMDNVELVSEHIPFITHARTRRRQLAAELADALNYSPQSALSRLVRELPQHFRRHMQAQIKEINRLLADCQRRLLENKLLIGGRFSAARLSLIDRPDSIAFGLN